VVVPIGGGGLCAGIASIVRQMKPDCEIIGVEPEGADSMHRSIASGRPESLEQVRTIADSLGAPFALPLSFELCRSNLDRLVLVSDDALRAAMRLLFSDMKIAVEPACAATTAALAGPLAADLAGKHVVLVFCGSNTDWSTWAREAGPDLAHAA
jgi:threonine dehydratase